MKRRKILSLALALVMALTLVPAMVAPAQAAPPSGSIIQDPNFYAAVLEVIGKADGYVITASDVAGIKELDVKNKSIKSLAGIEYFTALTEFDCYGNELTTLDVSKNTALTDLTCGGNKLTKLDVSNTASAGFKDIGSAASWATDSINFVRNAGIMQGTGDGNYNPKGTYTRQESIITFNNVK